MLMSRAAVLVGVVAAAAAACGARANRTPAPAERTVVWHQLGSWSGHGNTQTESFTSDTGALRIRWEATAQPSGATTAQKGVFRLTAHSAISGRLLEQIVDRAGAGSGVGYVQQDPHVFYLVVEASRLNWTFTVEEAIGYP